LSKRVFEIDLEHRSNCGGELNCIDTAEVPIVDAARVKALKRVVFQGQQLGANS